MSKTIPTSLVALVRPPMVSSGSTLRLSRGHLVSNEINVIDGAVNFKFVAPERYGAHCPDVAKSVLRGLLRFWNGTSWAAVTTRASERNCQSLTPGLYRSLKRSGKVLEYFSVG